MLMSRVYSGVVAVGLAGFLCGFAVPDIQALTADESAMVGTWSGDENYAEVTLVLNADGTYRYDSIIKLGHNRNWSRYTTYEGTWSLQASNSQVVLEIPNCERPLYLSNRFPKIYAPVGTWIYPDSSVDTNYVMVIDESNDVVAATAPSQAVMDIYNAPLKGIGPDYITFTAPKRSDPGFWGDLPPMAYSFGGVIWKDHSSWENAVRSVNRDPENYIIFISEEQWQYIIGHRKQYASQLADPQKVYYWLEFFKTQMERLSVVTNGIAYEIFAGDTPAAWIPGVRVDFGNSASNVFASVHESRFPEALEINAEDSMAGFFKVQDYLRMKYAPNVRFGYVMKERGAFNTVETISDFLNSLGGCFEVIGFNCNPSLAPRSEEDYLKIMRNNAKIVRRVHSRHWGHPKLWIWKVSTWKMEHINFWFKHIGMMSENEIIGLTLGHGNDLVRWSGWREPIKTYLHQYYSGKSEPGGATPGPVYWK